MPRIVQRIKVFVASPSDVDEERDRVQKVVRELNLGFPAESMVQLELIRWETHTYPDFGSDAQDVINKQIGTEYDIFIGILWSRAGTATPRSPSGTLEEFHRAYEKWRADAESITLMIYFKDEPISPSRLNSEQLALIQNFPKGLDSSGGLYWTFKTIDEFETELRLHLARAIQDWRTRLKNASISTASGNTNLASRVSMETPTASTADASDDEDLGFLDYMGLGADANARLLQVLARMSSAMESIGEKTNKRTAEFESVTKQPNLANARSIFEQSARDLNEFSAAIVAEIPKLAQAHSDLLRFLVGGAASSLDFGASGREQVIQVLTDLDGFSEVIQSTGMRTAEFRSSIARLPRMTVHFNKAKRRAPEVLEALASTYADLVSKNTRVRGELADLLARSENDQ